MTRTPAGTVGACPSGPPGPLTEIRSTLGPPSAVVAVARTVLTPAFRVTLSWASAQVSQVPVPGKFRAWAVALTVMAIGRLAVVPLAYLSVRV
jgi:hypothetical protein